ncbi:MAG: hypothetical protein JWP86_657 [Phenylobacterium sp.]|nr:hypothetical protein [Phenylobacterium sp.]
MILPLIPAQAGTQAESDTWPSRFSFPHARWVPAFAGMSGGE